MEELQQKGVQELVIFPLFPQYSTSTSLTSIRAARDLAVEFNFQTVRVIESYHDHPAYIQALSKAIQAAHKQFGEPERTLLSFHSIPRRYVSRKNDPYLSHCQQSSSLLIRAAGLDSARVETTFQSRFGPEPWLSPYLTDTLTRLGNEGCQSLQVICPGFSVDCLETLEEVALGGRELFQNAGGGKFHYIPALNAGSEHIRALSGIIEDFLDN